MFTVYGSKPLNTHASTLNFRQTDTMIFKHFQTSLFFLFSICIFFLCPFPALSHEIHLKSGKIITTNSIQKSGNTIRYDFFGGTVSIKKSDIEKIIYSQTKTSGQKPDVQKKRGMNDKDLASLLSDKLHPKTPVERANLATLSIKTHAGSGSGFFINDLGFIITNRHVVRGSEEQTEEVSEKLQEANKNIASTQKQFAREKTKIDIYEKKVFSIKQEIDEFRRHATTKEQKIKLQEATDELRNKQQSLDEWKNDFYQRKNEFEKTKNEFLEKKTDYKTKLSQLAGQYQFIIILADGTEKSATLYKISDSLDLALLKLNGFTTPYLVPAQKNEQSLGQTVFAIGSPLNLSNSVTSGVLSNYRGEYVQTNAEIYPGNSGGPLINESGEVLGVNTMKLITEKFEGLGFAIQIDEVLKEFADYF